MSVEKAYASADLAEDMLARHGERITDIRARSLHHSMRVIMRELEQAVDAESAVYEYRVLRPGRHFPSVLGDRVFRSDDEMWQKWTGDGFPHPGDGYENVDYSGLSGVEGIVKATAREAEADGAKGVRIERRLVGPWKDVER